MKKLRDFLMGSETGDSLWSSHCPVCYGPMSRFRLISKTAWGQWRCKECHSLLGINTKRRLLALIPCVGILIILLIGMRIMQWGMWVGIPIIVAAGLVNFFLFDRAVVLERVGFRCRRCGYDLQGQEEPVCPECGAALEEKEQGQLALIRAGTVRGDAVQGARLNPRRRWVLVVFLITAVLVTLGLVYAVYRTSTMGPRSAPSPASTSGVAQPNENAAQD